MRTSIKNSLCLRKKEEWFRTKRNYKFFRIPYKHDGWEMLNHEAFAKPAPFMEKISIDSDRVLIKEIE